MPKPQNGQELMQFAREAGVSYIRLIFADILGQSKNVLIPVSRLDEALAGRVTFDGGSIDGFVRDQEIDMILMPDIASFALLPVDDSGIREARLICDLVLPDGEAFEGCPRTTLRRVLDSAQDVLPGLTAALEVEFYLFSSIEKETPRTDDADAYFGFSVSDRGEAVRLAIVETLQTMGIPIAASHHEHGAGQHEIDFGPSNVLEAADRLLTLRMVAKQVAASFGMHATFMPKPIEASAGSGLHLYFAWGRDVHDEIAGADGRNEPPLPPEIAEAGVQFALEEQRDLDAQELQAALGEYAGPGEELLFGVGGLLNHAQACTAICNPLINSYKRLIAAWDAPVYTVWSHRSANALVRVPVDGRPRIEMRSPDPSCNPYLALAVLVASIIDGLRQRHLPGEAWTGSAYTINEQERIERGVQILPRSLREAIDELDNDIIIRNALGDHIYHAFCDAKMAEYERYRRTVHPWEHKAYLRAY